MPVHIVSKTYYKMKYTQGKEPYIRSATFCVRKYPEQEHFNLHNETLEDIQENRKTSYLWQ